MAEVTSFEVEPAAPVPAPAARRSIFNSSNRMRSLHRASVSAAVAMNDETFAKALQAEAEEFGEESAAKITSFEAIANFVIGCIGAGIVVFPKVMALNGYGLALLLILLSAVVCFETGRLMLAACEMAEACTGARPGSMSNYEDLAGAAFGSTGKTVLAITKNSYALGALFVYTVLLVEGVCSLLEFMKPNEDVVRWAVVTPCVLALSMITNLKQLARVAPLGTFAVFAQCAAICVGSVMAHWMDLGVHETKRSEGWRFASGGVFEVGSALSVFVFGFDGVVNLPSIRGQMSNPAELPNALRTGFAIVASFCIVVMCCGFFGFGGFATDNVIKGMTDYCEGFGCVLSGVASSGVTINLLISYPLIFFTVISFVESQSKGSLGVPMSPVNMVVRAVMGLMLMLVGLLFESPKDVISLVSAIFGSCLVIFFPVMIFYKLRREARTGGHRLQELRKWRKFAHWGLILTGAIAMIFGFLSEIKNFTGSKEGTAPDGGTSGTIE